MKGFILKTLIAVVVMVCACIAATGSSIGGAPEPAIVPKAGDWTVNATFTHPQQIILRNAPGAPAQRYWYVILSVVNKTGQDAEFYPKCDLMTDTFHITPAGKSVSPAVFDRIKEQHLTDYPFLEPFEKVSSKLLQGEDNAKDIAVIWPDFDPTAKKVKVFITGLSNESAAVKHPIEKGENGLPKLVFLRKTLELSYGIKGDPAMRAASDLTYSGKRWIMR